MECKNCERPLDPNDNFCKSCGAKIIENRLTLSGLSTEVREHVFNLDNNRPIHTFVDLFIRPEAVIDGFIQGVRKKYINPFAYLTIAITIFGLFLFFFIEEYTDVMTAASTSLNSSEVQNEVSNKVNEITLQYQSLIFFLFVPLLALLSKLVFLKNKKYNYVEHMVINTYGQAHISIAATLLYFVTIWFESVFAVIAGTITFINIFYFAYIFKRLFGLTFWQIFLKTLLFLVLLIPIIMVIGTLMWVVLLLTGKITLQELLEMQQASKQTSYIASSLINWTS